MFKYYVNVIFFVLIFYIMLFLNDDFYSQNGTICIAGARDRTLLYWKLPSHENPPSSENGNTVCTDSAHNGWIWDLTAIDNTIYSCSWDQSVKTWMLINTGLVKLKTYEM